MDIIFVNSKNSRTSDTHRLMFNLKNKRNLQGSKKDVALSNLKNSWKNIENSYKNNKFKTAPTWNEKFELPDGSYSVSDI